jgi:hypothetical protein
MNKILDPLCTATSADGHSLARRWADFARVERGAPQRDAAAPLSAPPSASSAMLTGVDLEMVAAAKAGWQR